MARRALLVGNPTARSGLAEGRIRRALEAMHARGWAARFVSTEPDRRTVGVVRDALSEGGLDVVVYLGGDGTFGEVAEGLLAADTGCALGMLPSGTANDQGKSFGISSDEAALDRNLDVIEAGFVQLIDVGRVERLDPSGAVTSEALFFDSVGWGFQSDVLRVRNRDRLRVAKVPLLRDLYRDQAVYAGAALNRYLSSWTRPTKFSATVVADGQTVVYEKLTDLVISATAIYGGEWVLERLSEPDDGLFELVPFQGRRELFSKAIRDLRHLPVWQEHLDALGVTHSRGLAAATFDLRFHRKDGRPIAAQLDGEEWSGGFHYRVSVIPRALPLVVDEHWVPPWQLG